MSARILYFLYLLGMMVGVGTLLLYIFFGSWFRSHWNTDPFGFWMVSGSIIALAIAGAARRALYSFHPGTAEAKNAK